jgi:rfaE bifunctional protein nucleotidyltransferase chain/domain
MPQSDLSHPAVLSLAALLERLHADRACGRRLVFTNGCFDVIHPGHVDLLARAKALGDILILGLNSDDSVKRQNKGADRPVNPFAVRAFVLAHLAAVDYVTEFREDTPLQLIRAVRPHVLVKGGDWSPERIVGRDIVEADGGRVCSLPLLPGYSTTALLAGIRAAAIPETSPAPPRAGSDAPKR